MSASYCPQIRPAEWFEHDSGLDWRDRRRRDAGQTKLGRIGELVAKALSTVETISVEERLREQADKWESETGHLSSPTQRIIHPSYQAILGIAVEHKDETLRFLLHDLRQNRRAWFWALSYLAQDNPIKPSDAGKMDEMIDAWVNWGKDKGLL